MILAADIGNSNTTLGLFSGESLVHRWRLSTLTSATADDLGISMRTLLSSNGVSLSDIDAIIYASVVPPLAEPFEKMCQRYIGMKPLKVAPGVKTGIDIRYENPREVGADRIANAVAVQSQYGGPSIVVDFGTATTFDVVSADGDYAGGAILPGVGLSTEALFEHAARLPRIDLSRPIRAVGRNTVESMRAGIIYGFAGSVDAVVARIEAEIGTARRVIATGGWAGLIAPECQRVDEVDPNLTLEGLRIIYMRNRT